VNAIGRSGEVTDVTYRKRLQLLFMQSHSDLYKYGLNNYISGFENLPPALSLHPNNQSLGG
jgi:hypothetical protein